MFLEISKFLIYSGLIVLISKYILVTYLRKLAENLNLKPKTVGDVAGYATSMPELLTICVSSFNGLISASMVNVFSSNVINLIQYMASIFFNKNKKAFTNRAIKVDLVMVFITIIIPVLLLWLRVEMNNRIIPIFIILYALFVYLNGNVHKVYLQNEDKKIAKNIEQESKSEKGNTRRTVLYIIILFFSGVLLFVVSQLLGDTLNSLCNKFNISQVVVGILLGFITSIPELITFFEAQQHYSDSSDNEILGVVEATNNLLTSNILNLFLIQSIGIIIYELRKL